MLQAKQNQAPSGAYIFSNKLEHMFDIFKQMCYIIPKRKVVYSHISAKKQNN